MTGTGILFLDTETTGLYANIHGIHQIAGVLDVDSEIISEFNSRMQPPIERSRVDPDALLVSNTNFNDLRTYPKSEKVFREFLKYLSQYVPGRFHKIYLSGYNVGALDVPFLREWFALNGRKELFGHFFYQAPIDVMSLSAEYFIAQNASHPVSYSLSSVATLLDLETINSDRHDALYDAKLCRSLYYKLKAITNGKTTQRSG